ncbi:MAG: acetoacetyl-CoA synthetase, partial [Verrucomicrobiota bacterium]|nr:acetoacetyl-CoA synthetase [Verrucomicrobiota bacterium]
MESVPFTADPLWRPQPDQIKTTNLAKFQEWLRDQRSLDLKDHRALYDWSVRDLEGFWSAIAEFFEVRFGTPAERVLHRDEDPGRAIWFPGGTLNYAEHLLRWGSPEISISDPHPAVLYCAEPGEPDN